MTARPSALWAAKVIRRAVSGALGQFKHLIRDRDGVFGEEFNAAMSSFGFRQRVTAYRAPLQNAHAERAIGTLRRE